MKIMEFWVRAHSDDQKEPSGNRLAGFIVTVTIVLCVAATLLAALFKHKELTDAGIKLVGSLGFLAAALYAGTQVRAGLQGLRSPMINPSPPTFGASPHPPAMYGQPPAYADLPNQGGNNPPTASVSLQPPTHPPTHPLTEAMRQAAATTQPPPLTDPTKRQSFLLRSDILGGATAPLRPVAALHTEKESKP